MFSSRNNTVIACGLICAIVLWGANNAGLKYLVHEWPPVWIACSRMYCVGALMMALLRWTNWLGESAPLTPKLQRDLWRYAGLSLACYFIAFTWALKYTSASHVALYLGASPVCALLWEGRPQNVRVAVRRYGAAALALSGLIVLFWPKLHEAGGDWRGDLLALFSSVLWTLYGRQCRVLGSSLSGVEITACTMWRAAVWLTPVAVWEVAARGLSWHWNLVGVQGYCVVFGGIVAFAFYNNALKHWPVSQVFLFGNLIPASTMAWAWLLLHEPVTRTFWMAMLLVVTGVVLGQSKSTKKPQEACLAID